MKMKNFIKWNSTLSVGITKFDDQHKKLISLINKFYESIQNKKSSSILNDIMQELLSYAEYHFKIEEDFFVKYNYNNPDHIQEHNNFIDRVKKLYRQCKLEKVMYIELIIFLTDWVSNHILVSDKAYSDFYYDLNHNKK